MRRPPSKPRKRLERCRSTRSELATLIALAGLPGTGKTTVARLVAQGQPAVFLRIDEIEAVLRVEDERRDIGPLGYKIAAALAVSNLKIGQDVIVDCVNPWPLTRAMFADAATHAAAAFLGVEVVCSSADLHRDRIENRVSDIGEGHAEPDWQAVIDRDYMPWRDADVHVDTAKLSPEAGAKRILSALRA